MLQTSRPHPAPAAQVRMSGNHQLSLEHWDVQPPGSTAAQTQAWHLNLTSSVSKRARALGAACWWDCLVHPGRCEC